MALAVDSTSFGKASVASTLTISHTIVSNTDGVLVVGACSNDVTPAAVSSVTYNGSALTSIGSFDGQFDKVSLWRLLAPSTGTHDIVITYAASQSEVQGGAVAFTGADQTTPASGFAGVAAEGDVGPAVSTIVSATGEVVVTCVYGLNIGGSPTVDQTLQWNQLNGVAGIGSGMSTASGAASVVTTWTLPGAFGGTRWNVVGASIKPSSGGSSGKPHLYYAQQRAA